jgi:hypothetical protein
LGRRAYGGKCSYVHLKDQAKRCEGFGDNTLWIITEADRNVTTFLLPGEYCHEPGPRFGNTSFSSA